MLQCSQLEDSDWRVRHDAMTTLGNLRPETLAQHAGAVVVRLEDSHWDVRHEALETLDKLKPAALAQYAGAMVASLSRTSIATFASWHWRRWLSVSR